MAKRRRSLSAAALRILVEKRALGRCEYCHARQRICGYRFHVEHIIPRVQGGSDEPFNRALACAPCNLAKSAKAVGTDPRTRAVLGLFNPRWQSWNEHFRWAADRASLVGLTPTGRATIAALDMNNELQRESRRFWFDAGWLP